MTLQFPITQVIQRPGIIDLGWGSPDPALIPVTELADSAATTISHMGPSALAYGAPQGPGPLIEWLSHHVLGEVNRQPQPERIVITAGASQALDLFCTLFVEPGDTVLVESPCFHLARKILLDHSARLAPLTSGVLGPDANELRETLAKLRSKGERCRLMYCIPTFNNPTGRSWPQHCRDAIIEVAAAEELTIIEDDVYRDCAYDEPAYASLFERAPDGIVVRLGSFSKTVGPGLRLGWLQAHPMVVSGITDSGLLDSGGGINHLTAMVMQQFCLAGHFDSHLERMRGALRERRDALVTSLAECLPPGCSWTVPNGGYYVWLELPRGSDVAQFLPIAESHGVSFLPGALFFLSGGGVTAVRLAFSMYSSQELCEASRRLGVAIREWMIHKNSSKSI
jgi:2-aminoadipate transaminase